MKQVSGLLNFGQFELRWDAIEGFDGELIEGTIDVTDWHMRGESWTDAQLERVYGAIETALREVDTSIDSAIRDHHANRLPKPKKAVRFEGSPLDIL